jgi:uncharacterized protein YkwD
MDPADDALAGATNDAPERVARRHRGGRAHRRAGAALVLATAATLLGAAVHACPGVDEQRRALALINERRLAGVSCGDGALPTAGELAWSDAVAGAALAHAERMASDAALSHLDAEGRDGGQRLVHAGLRWSAWAENLARARIGVDRLVALWFASPGHCANLMLPQVSYAGLGCARAADGDDYWALLLWRPSPATAIPTAPVQSPPAARPKRG